MKCIVIVTALMILIPYSLQSETFDFDLKTFSPPDYTRTSLEFSSNFSTNHTTREFNNLLSHEIENTVDAFYDSDIQGTYSYYRYSQKRISDMSFNLLYKYDNSFSEYDDFIDTDVANTEIRLAIQRNETLYAFNNYFITIGAGTAYVFRKRYNPEHDDRMQRQYRLEGTFGFGWGRLENVGYARTALFMYEDMQKYGVLQTPPSADDIRDLATLIAQRKNLRSLDYRDNFVDNIKAFDQFFKDKSNVTSDISCMAAYTDVFHNMPQTQRFNGSRLHFGFRTMYANILEEDYDMVTDSIIETQTGFLASINYDYENPLSQKWQLSFDYSSRYVKENREIEIMEEIIDTVSTTGFMHDIDLSLGYYPTQRTSFTASSAMIYQTLDGEMERFDGDSQEITMKMFGVMIELGVDYYFSPNVRMFASTGTLYQYTRVTRTDSYDNDDTSQNGYDFILQTGITYKVF